MPRILTTTGIVLNRMDWRESSRLVTFLSPEMGKLRAVARGVRKPSSGIGPALEPAVESQIVLSISERSDLAQIRDADVVEYFGGLRGSFVRLALASAVCELVDSALPEADEAHEAYAHVREALLGIEAADDAHAVTWLWRAVLLLAGDFGYAIRFGQCAACGSTEEDQPAFSLADGAPVCRNCVADACRRWTPEARQTLEWLSGVPDTELNEYRIAKAINREIRQVFESYFRYHVPDFHRLRSLDILSMSADDPPGEQ